MKMDHSRPRRCSRLDQLPVIRCSNRRLLFTALSGFFSVLVKVLDHALENEQVGVALARELDAITVIPLDRAAKDLAILENNSHWGVGLHLFDPVKVFSVGHFRWSWLFVRNWAVVRRAGWALLLDVREARAKHAAVHHDYS